MAVFLVVMIVLLVVADQLVKQWAVDVLMPIKSMDFIHFGDFKIIDLTYLENDGAIFGSMSGQKWFLVGFTSLVILAGIILMFVRIKQSKLFDITMGLFIAGGIGNLIDRIRYGYVVDMFEIKLFRFAIFNVADICVTVACVLMLVNIVFIEPKTEKAKREAGGNAE